MQNESSIDALLAMAAKAEATGAKKANMDSVRVFVLSVLARAFIALGAVFATTAVAGASGHIPYGVTRVLAGIVFSLVLFIGLSICGKSSAETHAELYQLAEKSTDAPRITFRNRGQ